MKKRIREEIRAFRALMKSVPSLAVTMLVTSVFCMNLLANKSLHMPFEWLAADGGILFSWITFLALDVITKHFGAKAATQLSMLAIACNLLFCGMFYVGSRLGGVWGESYVPGSEDVINKALDGTFGGTWYVVLGSMIAFGIASAVNNFVNAAIGRMTHGDPNGFAAYALRTYVSTAVGQLTDNLVFALFVSHVFFGWTLGQCVSCAVAGMAVEVLCEAVFAPVGYRICERWRKENVGAEYLTLYARKG